MIDHTGVAVSNFDRSKEFYARARAPIGLRPHYHPHYYGAFVLEPGGYNIEAVCHEPQ